MLVIQTVLSVWRPDYQMDRMMAMKIHCQMACPPWREVHRFVGIVDVCWFTMTHFGFWGGNLFKLHSRASNGNVYSTLLFATAPAQ